MSKNLEFESGFVEELSQLGVRVGLAPVEVACRSFFGRGVDFCLGHRSILKSIIKTHIPNGHNYRRLIKGSANENKRVGQDWRRLFDISHGVDKAQLVEAIDSVTGILAEDTFRSRDRSHVLRIILAIGAAQYWVPPENEADITAVGQLLKNAKDMIDNPPPQTQQAA